MQPLTTEKTSSNEKKHHTLRQLFTIKAHRNIEEMMEKQTMGIESSCTKSKKSIAILTEAILTAALRETEFQEEPYQYSDFGYLGPSGFPFKEPKGLFSNQLSYTG